LTSILLTIMQSLCPNSLLNIFGIIRGLIDGLWNEGAKIFSIMWLIHLWLAGLARWAYPRIELFIIFEDPIIILHTSSAINYFIAIILHTFHND